MGKRGQKHTDQPGIFGEAPQMVLIQLQVGGPRLDGHLHVLQLDAFALHIGLFANLEGLLWQGLPVLAGILDVVAVPQSSFPCPLPMAPLVH